MCLIFIHILSLSYYHMCKNILMLKQMYVDIVTLSIIVTQSELPNICKSVSTYHI